MCNIACQESTKTRCRCSCGGIMHGLRLPTETRLEILKELFGNDTILYGNAPSTAPLCLDLDGKNIKLINKNDAIWVRDNMHGKDFPLSHFRAVRGIPF